jgi:hypothetical protein
MIMSKDMDDLLEDDLGLDAINSPTDLPLYEGDIIEDDKIFDDELSKDTSILNDLLKAKGISGGKIIVLDENNEETEVDFYGLPKEEQLDILNSVEESTAKGDLSEEESLLISHLRENEISLEDYLGQYRESIIAELSGNTEVSYDIDAYDDEELYLLDLKTKYDLTDDELVKELERALEDKDLFTKKVTKLRTDYKQLEDTYKANQQQEAEAQQEVTYNKYVETMVDVAVKTPELYGIELEDAEKNEVLTYLLDVNSEGLSDFNKALKNPQKLYEAAWFLKYGKDAFDAIKNAYESEIAKLKKDIPKVVIKNNTTKTNSIHDL